VTAVIVLGVLLALALLQLRWLAFPPAPDLIGEIDEWRRGRELATQRATGGPAPVSPMGRLIRWVVETISHYRPEWLDRLAPDLAITQRDLHTWLTRVVTLTVTFGFGPIVLMLARRAGGHHVSWQWGPILGLALAAAAVLLSVRDLRTEAARVRDEFSGGISTFLFLVAMSMEAGKGHAEALPAAAKMGANRVDESRGFETRVFSELRETIRLAPDMAMTSWGALGRLGERYGIRELVTLRSSVQLASDDGARVKQSIVSLAKSMQSARLGATLERSNNATESMRQLTVIAAGLAGVYLAAPYILSLRSAAGLPG
jgi:tight adherence protein C